MRILLTGITSFLGRAAAEALLAAGHEVTAPVRGLEGRRSALMTREHLRYADGDLSEPEAFRERCLEAMPEGADLCLHFGWGGIGVKGRMDPTIQAANVNSTLRLMELCGELGVKRFLFSGSQAEYGMTLERIQREGLCGPFDESVPCAPVSEYGKGKLRVFREAGALAERLGIEYIHLRIFSVYGPGDHSTSLVETVVKAAAEGKPQVLGPCRQDWNFLHIDDFAAAAVKLCEMPAAGSQAVNVGSQDTRPLRAFAEEIMETAGRDRGLLTFEERPVGPEGTPFLSPDTSRLTSLTGFAPAVRFAEGIRRRLHI